MFPLDVVLIGCGGELATHVRMELGALGARVETEYLGLETAVADLKAGRADEQARQRNGLPAPGATGPHEPGKRLFIVNLHSPNDLASLKRLSGAAVGQPILTLLGFTGDAGVPIAVQRHGAHQVVLLPFHADDFRSAMEGIALQHGLLPTENQVISVAGVTGGSGATTIAINLAYELALTHRKRVILTELSLQMGKLAIFLNVEPRFTTHDLLREVHRTDLYFLQQSLVRVADRLQLLAGPYDSVSSLSARPADVLLLLECLRQLAEVVVVDMPSTFDTLYFDTLNASDRVVLVGQQKVPSIRSLQVVASSLAGRPPHMVLNRYDPGVPGFRSDRIRQMLNVEELFTIASDYPSVSAAMNQGRPLRVQAPKSRVVGDIARLTSSLMPQAEEAAPAKAGSGSGVFGGLFRKLGIR
jgi:pilus assembly protein CpaE